MCANERSMAVKPLIEIIKNKEIAANANLSVICCKCMHYLCWRKREEEKEKERERGREM